MKIILLALVMGAASLIAAPAAVAAPGGKGGYFVEAMYGQTDVWADNYQKQTTGLLAGYRWNTGFGKLGFELGYVDFGDVDSGTPSITYAFYGQSIDAHALKAGANLNFTFEQGLYLEPRIGLMRFSYTGADRNFPNSTTYYDETKIGHYAGIGLGFWIAPNFALSFNVDNYPVEILGQTKSLDTFSIGLQFQF